MNARRERGGSVQDTDSALEHARKDYPFIIMIWLLDGPIILQHTRDPGPDHRNTLHTL
jgi:hypothetical protein